MGKEVDEPVMLVGLVRPREHCTFTWLAHAGGGRRSAQVRVTHCPECVAELRRRGYLIMSEEPEEDQERQR